LLLLFTGAGFAAGAGAPVMRAFLEHAENTLPEPVLRCMRPGFYFSGYSMKEPPNLETAYGAMVFRQILHGPHFRVATREREGGNYRFVPSRQGPTVSEVITGIERGITTIYGQPTDGGSADAPWLVYYCDLFRHILTHFRLAIVTTNYDLVAETVLNRIGQPNSYCLGSHQGDAQPIPILKLHGSVNWPKQGALDLKSLSTSSPLQQDARLLPPTWNKDLGANDVFADVWRDAAKVIGTAHVLLVVGQSFPRTDLHLDYLLAEGLAKSADNPEPKRVLVADADLPTAMELCNRFMRYQTIGSASAFGVRFECLLSEIQKGSILL